jgi:GAF domain-containing protein
VTGEPPPVHIDPGALAASLGALATSSSSEVPPIEASLAQVIDATRRLFAVTGVGLMLVDAEGALRYVGATDAPARALETAQEDLGVGPCVDGFVRGEVVTTSDLARDARWPELSERVVPDGVAAVLGVPTRVAGTVVGSLNVYRAEPYEWDASDIAAVEAHSEVLETMIGSAMVAQQRGVVVDQLQNALERRVVVERAIGMLMERHGVPDVVAFGALRRAARDARRPVADLAARVLEGEDMVGGRLPRPETA